MKKEFLKSINPKKALETIEALPVSNIPETVDIEEALERILAEDMVSSEDIPPFSRSLVDGYAVKARDTHGAKETNPSFLTVLGQVRVGEGSDIAVEHGKSVTISTGAMLPENADGVVMEEHVRCLGEEIEITRPVYKGENICYKGEDIKKGDVLKKTGERLSAFDIGVCAALGISRISVFKKPRIAVISSGDEIVDIAEMPPQGKVRDINRYTITNILKKEGVSCDFLGIVKDSIDEITLKLNNALVYDMIIVSGGSSKGERDFIVDAVGQLGGKILFHGINIKPGKPVIFGTLHNKPFFGLPGHPVSSIMVMIRFVLPMIKRLKGETQIDCRYVIGRLETNVPSSYGIEEYVRASVRFTDSGCTVTPVFAKSSVISSLAKASGYIIVPEGMEGYEKGEEVEVYPFWL